MSCRPPCGSTCSPPPTGTAMALIVKSREARSASMPSRSGVKSTVRPERNATRQAPCRSDSGNTAPPAAWPYARAARSGSGQATSRSTTSRPSNSSRTAPPTTYASCPCTAAATSSSIDDRPVGAPGICPNSACDLVVDRVESARVLLGKHAVSDQRDGSADALVPELDGTSPGEDRVEPVRRGVIAERRQAVERDSAAHGVEARLGKSEGGGAVR